MKVLLLATTYPRRENDTLPDFVHGLARKLVEHRAQVTVIAPHDKDTVSDEVIDGVRIHRIHYWLPKSAHGLCYGAGIPTNVRQKKWLALQFPPLEAAFFAAALRYGRDADVINPHWAFAALPAVIAAKLLRKPVVTHAYGAEYIPKALRPVNRFIVNASDAVISISSFTRSLVEAVAQPKVHHVIGYGVNPAKVAPPDFDAAAFRAAHDVKPDEFFVFAVGRLVERKGHAWLIESAARLIQQGKPVRVMIAGKGPLRETLQAQIDGLGLGDHIHLLGFVSDAELSAYLAAADVLVMPSLPDKSGDTEGLGIPPLEGMINGTPVISAETGGLRDVVRHEETGLFVPPGDVEALATALDRMREDAALRERLINNGRQTVATTFDWDTIARRTLDVYENSMRGK